MGIVGLNVFHQLDAVAVRQIHVGDAEVEFFLLQADVGGFHIGGGVHLNVHAGQGEFQQFANVRFIVNDQGFVGTHVKWSLLSNGHYSGRMGKGDSETAAAAGGDVVQPRLVGLAQFQWDIPPQGGGAFFRSIKGVEDFVAHVVGDAGTSVDDIQCRLFRLNTEIGDDTQEAPAGVFLAVAQAVLEQVGEHLADLGRVDEKGEIGRA